MNAANMLRLAQRLGDWDATEALLQLQAEEYQRDAIAEERARIEEDQPEDMG